MDSIMVDSVLITDMVLILLQIYFMKHVMHWVWSTVTYGGLPDEPLS